MKIKLILAAVLLSLLAVVPHRDPDPKKAPAIKVAYGLDHWDKAFPDVYRVLLVNLRDPDKKFSTHNAVPGPQFKNEVYLWDTAFISQVWKWWDPIVSQEIFTPLFQIQHDDGMIPHSSEQTHDTQPPLLSWSAWQIYLVTGDRVFLEESYPHLKAYNQWLYKHRKMVNNLFFWDNRFESGLDNSPRFTNRAATRIIVMDQIAAVDMNAYMVKDNESLAMMAEALGRPVEAIDFKVKAQELKDLVNQYLWDEKDGMYYDFDFQKSQFVKINTNGSFIPLFAGIPDDHRARKLMARIMDPGQYNTLIPLPTVALNDPNYFLDMWRGPTWINVDYMIILGMKDYGFGPEAAELSWKVADALYKMFGQSGKFYEFYDPQKLSIQDLHRKTGFMGLSTRRDKPVEDFVGWTGLVDNLVIEVLFGLDRTDVGWALSPALPAQTSGKTLLLSIPSQGLEITLNVNSPDEIQALVVQNRKQMTFMLGDGKSVNW